MASWAGSLLAAAAGVEPVMQLTCRDRNRLALQSDLLAAAALGIPNVLLMTGDHPRFGDHPDGKPVFDLDGMGLIQAARTMRDEGVLLSGRPLSVRPDWLIGAAENPFAPPAGRAPPSSASGRPRAREFVQTQFVFDVAAFGRWMAAVRDLGLDQRCRILAGVGPVRSLRALARLRSLPGVHIPGEVERRLSGVLGRPGRRGRTGHVRGDHRAGPADPRRERRTRHGARIRARDPPHPRTGRARGPSRTAPPWPGRGARSSPPDRGTAVPIDVRLVAKLTGPDPVDVTAVLAPVFTAPGGVAGSGSAAHGTA